MNPWLIAGVVIAMIFTCGAINMVLQGRLHAKGCKGKFFKMEVSDWPCSHEWSAILGFIFGPLLLIPTIVYSVGCAISATSDWHVWRMAQLRKKQERADAELKLKETKARAAGIQLWANPPIR